MGSYEFMNPIVHRALRRDLRRMGEVIETPPPRDPLPQERRQALARRATWLVDFLHKHHEGEDRSIWPLAASKVPDLAPLLAQMEAEHGAVAATADAMSDAALAYAHDGSESRRAGLAAALDSMVRAVLPHLEHEEGVTMPQVLGIIDEDEWARIDKQFRKGVGLKELGWIAMWLLDDLPGEDLAILKSQVPRPVFAYLNWRYGSRYDREAKLAFGDRAGRRTDVGVSSSLTGGEER